MSEAEERLSRTEVSENTSGVVLGYWDHEKTPTLIQDLEQSVSLVELKCKKLLEELTQYKKYLEKPGEIDFHLAVFKKKNQKLKFSGSEPEIAFRKNCIHFQKIKQLFEEKFQEKLRNINEELKEAAHKIGLKESIILLPINEYLIKLTEQSKRMEEPKKNEEENENENEVEDEGKEEDDYNDDDDDDDDDEEEEKDENENDGDDIREKFLILSNLKGKTRSDSVLPESGEDFNFSKITKNQLKLYQKLSRLNMKKRCVRKLKDKKMKVKFSMKRKTLKYRKGFMKCRRELKKPKHGMKTTKKRKNRVAVLLKSRSSLPRDSNSTVHSRDSKVRQSSGDADFRNLNKPRVDVTKNEKKVESSSALGAALRKAMPFTSCASTSRSYNIGLNMQQLLSLPKYGRKAYVRISASEKMHKGARETNIEGLISKPSVADVKKRHSTPWTHFQTKSKSFDNKEHRENTWVLTSRKVRSKTTERSPNGVFKYLKSTTSQFTNGQKSMIQSESKTAYAVGSKIMVSDCQRTDIFEIGKSNNCYKNASGDGKSNNKRADLNVEWSKVYNSFLKIYRKYTYFKEKVSSSNTAQLNEELKSLEKDIDYSIEKYKEFLQFYTKFLALNHRLKSLKIACETKMFEPVTSFSSNCQKKISSYKPTHSMAMKDAFREVQALQAKINLVND